MWAPRLILLCVTNGCPQAQFYFVEMPANGVNGSLVYRERHLPSFFGVETKCAGPVIPSYRLRHHDRYPRNLPDFAFRHDPPSLRL
jgi:hypothetical protein